jgi:hypothetical protein
VAPSIDDVETFSLICTLSSLSFPENTDARSAIKLFGSYAVHNLNSVKRDADLRCSDSLKDAKA